MLYALFFFDDKKIVLAEADQDGKAVSISQPTEIPLGKQATLQLYEHSLTVARVSKTFAVVTNNHQQTCRVPLKYAGEGVTPKTMSSEQYVFTEAEVIVFEQRAATG